MDIKKIYQEESLEKYLIKGVTPVFMNTLRRTIMTSVPCLAVDEVTFYENNSVVFDEMLANRLGLLPIKTDAKEYKEGDKVKLILEKEGPAIVTSKDIKCTDPKIEIVDKKIYITKLGKGQKLKVEMSALMDTGKKHAKFQPAIVSYNELPFIDNENSKVKNAKELVEDMPEGTIELKAGKLFLLDPYNTSTQNQFVDILTKHGAKLAYSNNEFILTIESTGQLSSKELIDSAVQEIKKNLEELEEGLGKL